MPRGGYRSGAGRPKGKKDSKPRTRRKTLDARNDAAAESATEKLEPLAYMLKVMNDQKADPARRDRMAVAAAPFVHPKAIDQGKKEKAKEAAKRALTGRFAPSTQPKLKIVKQK